MTIRYSSADLKFSSDDSDEYDVEQVKKEFFLKKVSLSLKQEKWTQKHVQRFLTNFSNSTLQQYFQLKKVVKFSTLAKPIEPCKISTAKEKIFHDQS